MSFNKDSPLSSNKDYSPSAMLARYTRANELAIITNNEIVFQSLADIPYLLDKIKELQQANKELEEQVNTCLYGDGE